MKPHYIAKYNDAVVCRGSHEDCQKTIACFKNSKLPNGKPTFAGSITLSVEEVQQEYPFRGSDEPKIFLGYQPYVAPPMKY
jgi:hypothetical protein